MGLTKKKPAACPFEPDQVVQAVRSFACDEGTINQGARFRASDPIVQKHWGAFIDGAAPPSELENMWAEMPPPPEHRPPIQPTVPISPHRQVRCMVDRYQPGAWAPGSPGERSGGPPPPFGSIITRMGEIYDALDPRVAANPSEFVWCERPVTEQDLERLQRFEGEELDDAA